MSFIWISQVAGNFGNSLFLNYVSELLIIVSRELKSWILQRAVARVLLKFSDLFGLFELIIIYLRSSVKGIYSKTSIIAVLIVLSLDSKESTTSQI